MNRRRTHALFAIALLLIAACGGKGTTTTAPSTTTTTTEATTTTAAPPPPVYPLTGLPVTDPAIASRPALVVKIDNADGGRGNTARPQLGLNQADVVYEEMVEGSVTRLAAVFQSTDADPIGPVRSARSTDVAVFSPLNRPLFAWSGANAGFAELIRQSPLVDVGYDAHSELYMRRNQTGHVAPHNLYSSVPALYSLTPAFAPPPNPLFSYRAAGEPLLPAAAPINSVNLVFGSGPGSAPVDYVWAPDAGGFARSQKGSPDVDENGVPVAPQNVIVQFVTYHDTGYRDVVGTPVPEADLVGAGNCWILTNGAVIDGNWAKSSPEAIPVYTDKAGNPAKLTPGRTWVELVPIGGGTITG
ncbi:MAG TPA: DUF3048 domain-containing protein [Acidimicrobiales bacterium]|jgi:hypothetical protein|nr:DUF3048 domain-containing protein [Acidimicrobiales bacterium]